MDYEMGTWNKEEIDSLKTEGYTIEPEEEEELLGYMARVEKGDVFVTSNKLMGDFLGDDPAMWSFMRSGLILPPWKDKKNASGGGRAQSGMGLNPMGLFVPDYEVILKKLTQADNLWLVSDTCFGFLDHKGKRVMDRIMPMLNMTIGFRDGWMRHELRYHALNIGLLYKGDADQTMMEDWCNRTAANIGGHSHGATALGNNAKQSLNEREIKPVISGRPEHLVIINGSPRVAKFSNTDKIIHSFVKGLEETGITWELYNLSNRKEWDAAREAFLSHKHTLIAFPLYVECMPSLMLEFLESLPSERRQPAQLSFLLHGGMDEGSEFRFCERIFAN